MGIAIGTIWEVRDTGASTNGGGFKNMNDGTSVDYSQQDSAQLSLSDLVSDGAGTGISSATGGFTAAMEGNVMYITGGTGFTTGFYQITGYTDTNNITIDRSASASQTGGTGNVGGAFDFGSNENAFFGNADDGHTFYIKSGTYTLSEAVDVGVSGDDANPIAIRGYVTNRSTVPTGDDRPLIDRQTYEFWVRSVWQIEHLRFGCTDEQLKIANNCYLLNCKFFDTGDAAYYALVEVDGYGTIFYGCEFISTGQPDSYGLIDGDAEDIYAFGCYFHGSGDGAGFRTDGLGLAVGCVFDTLGYGVYGSDQFGNIVIHNSVFYNCAYGIHIWRTDLGASISNCIFHSCTTGINGENAGQASPNRHCAFYNNTTDINNGIMHSTCLTSDPQLVDPANGDFTLNTGSPCFDAGIGLNWAGLGS